MIIFKLLGLVALLLVVPFALGLVPYSFLKIRDEIGNTIIYGYLFMLALLELVGVPIVLICNVGAYYIFVIAFGVVVFGFSVWGIVLNRGMLGRLIKDKRNNSIKNNIKGMSLEAKIYAGIILLLLLGQLFMVFVYASMDADDFYYNAQALTSQQFGTMYRIDANTGRSTYLDIRHALALFPMWQAFVSTVTNIHLAIVAHKVLPLIIIPLSYLLIYQIAKELFPKKQEQQLMFVLLMNVWKIFGFVSYFTTETFFLLRTWQGKSVAGNFILPGIIWVFLMMYRQGNTLKFENKRNVRLYFVLVLCVLASGSSSSLAVMLSCLLIGLLSFLFLLRDRDIKAFLGQICCCVPGILYILVYVLAK